MVAHLFPVVVMAVAEAKEPRIAGRTAIRVLKQHMVKEPIFEAAFSRMEEFFATAIGTTRDSSSLRNGFVHGEFLWLGTSMLQRLAVFQSKHKTGRDSRNSRSNGQALRRHLRRMKRRFGWNEELHATKPLLFSAT